MAKTTKEAEQQTWQTDKNLFRTLLSMANAQQIRCTLHTMRKTKPLDEEERAARLTDEGVLYEVIKLSTRETGEEIVRKFLRPARVETTTVVQQESNSETALREDVVMYAKLAGGCILVGVLLTFLLGCIHETVGEGGVAFFVVWLLIVLAFFVSFTVVRLERH